MDFHAVASLEYLLSLHEKNNYSKVNSVTIDLYTGVENKIAFCFSGSTFYILMGDDLET